MINSTRRRDLEAEFLRQLDEREVHALTLTFFPDGDLQWIWSYRETKARFGVVSDHHRTAMMSLLAQGRLRFRRLGADAYGDEMFDVMRTQEGERVSGILAVEPTGYGIQMDAATLKDLDPGIQEHVRVLREGGIETFESCQGGEGHPFPEPTVRFHGGQGEGMRAYAVAHAHGMSVSELRRYWTSIDGELVGPHWEMTFSSRGRTVGAGRTWRAKPNEGGGA